MVNASGHDVVVIGEALVELHSDVPLTDASSLALSFSGDALNAAAAAAATGARTALVTRVGDDELGAALCNYAAALNVDVSFVVWTDDPNGIYFAASDPLGTRQFDYHRRGSAASGLDPSDLDEDLLAASGVLWISGVGCAISLSSEATMFAAARTMSDTGGKVVYDPNYRPRLTTVATARRHLRDLAPDVHVVTPSCPHDTVPLLDREDPRAAAQACLEAGADIAAVTVGDRGVLIDGGDGHAMIPAVPPEQLVDTTGCGDAFSGALAARIAAGEPIELAAKRAVELASRCVAHRGGTHYLTRHGDPNSSSSSAATGGPSASPSHAPPERTLS